MIYWRQRGKCCRRGVWLFEFDFFPLRVYWQCSFFKCLMSSNMLFNSKSVSRNKACSRIVRLESAWWARRGPGKMEWCISNCMSNIAGSPWRKRWLHRDGSVGILRMASSFLEGFGTVISDETGKQTMHGELKCVVSRGSLLTYPIRRWAPHFLALGPPY